MHAPVIHPAAPEWQTTAWLNTDAPLSVAGLRGRVIFVHAFQILCPGCVSLGIPQAQRVMTAFAAEPLVVVGLHSVFEHHDAMPPASLRAFLHEYRVKFPVAVDAPGIGDDPIPRTMRAYAMRGTPTSVLIDARGRIRRQVFGAHDDLALGAELQTLLLEAKATTTRLESAGPTTHDAARNQSGCVADGCRLGGKDEPSPRVGDP